MMAEFEKSTSNIECANMNNNNNSNSRFDYTFMDQIIFGLAIKYTALEKINGYDISKNGSLIM